MQATDNQPLFHDQAGSEDAVQPAGKQAMHAEWRYS